MNNSPNNEPLLVRQPAVAGQFYPADPRKLRQVVDGYLGEAVATRPAPKAIIVPHAGYIYSGPVAASAYVNLISVRDKISRVILLGPAHRVYVKGLVLDSATHFATPLGMIKIDKNAIEMISGLPQISISDIAHAQEHSLEVQLPFLQSVLDNFLLVPLVVGEATPQEVAEILELLWGSDETLIVISSDLSHYHDYTTATRLDQTTTQAIENLQLEKIGPQQACGCMPMRGLLKIAHDKDLQVKTLDLRNSGDTAGPRDRVVGYGAYSLSLN